MCVAFGTHAVLKDLVAFRFKWSRVFNSAFLGEWFMGGFRVCYGLCTSRVGWFKSNSLSFLFLNIFVFFILNGFPKLTKTKLLKVIFKTTQRFLVVFARNERF